MRAECHLIVNSLSGSDNKRERSCRKLGSAAQRQCFLPHILRMCGQSVEQIELVCTRQKRKILRQRVNPSSAISFENCRRIELRSPNDWGYTVSPWLVPSLARLVFQW
jgi:hypothetical protein